jgi:2,5-dihydroxypyridine 5,6-dioxygenase
LRRFVLAVVGQNVGFMLFGGGKCILDPFSAALSDVDPDLSAVGFALVAGNKAGFDHAVDNLGHGRLVLECAGGDVADRHAIAVAQAGENPPFCNLQSVLFQMCVKLRTDFATRAGEEIEQVVIDETISHDQTLPIIYSFSYKYSCATFALQSVWRTRVMFTDRIEGKWIDMFCSVFQLCKLEPGDTAAILSETQSRDLNVHLAELALARMGVQAFHVKLVTPPQATPVPVRSTGASNSVQGIEPVVAALGASTMVVDCTVEGLLHAPELPRILKGGARLLMVSNEHPDVLERLVPDPELTPKVKTGIKMLSEAGKMTVRSDAGTDLNIDITDTRGAGVWGYCDRPGHVAHWPGGLVLCFPKAGAVNGTLVMDAGDVNLTFKRYLESPITLKIENDFVTDIGGTGVDADLFREYISAWGDEEAYALSHVGWGMNPAARWDSLAMYDKRDVNGTELRAFAGNFLYSTGANETAKRFTLGHFDLPIRNCTVSLDDTVVVKNGDLQGDLA